MSPAAVKSDFVQVQLTAAGVAFAGAAGVVRVGNGHFDYTFKAGTPVRMLSSEWRKHFSKQRSSGQPIFEIAGGSAAATTAAPAQPSLAQLKQQEQQIAAEIAADQAAGQQ
jgi:hypothetical protein